MQPPDASLPAPPPGKHGWPWQTVTQHSAPSTQDSKNAWPKITVVTPSYNQGKFLEATLRSILLQHYPNLETIVLDGGSSDNSVEVIKRYAPHLTYWQSQRDDGQAAAIKSGLAMATGEIFCWLNSDDIFLPGALHNVGAAFRDRPRLDVLYGNRLVIDRDGAVTGRHIWPWRLTKAHWALGQPLAQEATFWRRSAYEAAGGLDAAKFFIMDYDLFFRMWRRGRFAKTSVYLGCLRIHEETKNTRHVNVWQRELREARERYGLKLPGYIGSRVLNRSDRLQLWLEERFSRRSAPKRGQWGMLWKCD